MKPFITDYPGAKNGNGTYHNIINRIPKHQTYCELFCGSAAIFRIKKMAKNNIINDISSNVYKSLIKSDLTKNLLFVLKYENGLLYETIDGDHILVGNCDYDYYLNSCSCYEDPFYYLDVPYLKSVRKSNVDIYEYEWNDQDHIDFLKKIVTVKAKIMISHYQCELYNEYLKGWTKHTFTSMTRNGPVEECIYYNYPTPTILQDYNYVGHNFTRRQQLKRISDRLISKLNKMDEIERNCILDSIYSKFENLF